MEAKISILKARIDVEASPDAVLVDPQILQEVQEEQAQVLRVLKINALRKGCTDEVERLWNILNLCLPSEFDSR